MSGVRQATACPRGHPGSHEPCSPRGRRGGPVFNATFYATGATVIPVLFLALAVQGRGFGELLRAATMGREEAAANKRRDPVLLFPPRVLLAAAWVIMAASFVGEGVAMYDLYSGSASSGLDGITVLAATLV